MNLVNQLFMQPSDDMNHVIWEHIYHSIAVNCFEWNGLPDNIDIMFLENSLLFNGKGVFFLDDFGVLQFQPNFAFSRIDMYNNPIDVTIHATNGLGKWERTNGVDCIIAYDNINRVPIFDKLDFLSERLADIDNKIDVNISAQATPWVITCSDDSAINDARRKMSKILNNEPVIVEIARSVGDTDLHVLRTDAPWIAENMLDVQEREFNIGLHILGLDKQFSNKKERLITDEVNSASEYAYIMRNNRLEARNSVCDRINSMFGLNVSVKWAVDKNNDGSIDLGVGVDDGFEDSD